MSSNKEFALSKLSALKERLLDLTARNRMINSNFNARTKQHFRIIDEVPQQIYDKLSNSSMVFNPLVPVEDEPRDENRAQFKEKLRKAQHTDLVYQEKLNELQGNLQKENKLLRDLKDKVRVELGWEPFQGNDISPQDHAIKHGINPSYELPADDPEGEKKYQDNKIQTLFFQDQLNAYVNTVWRNYKSSQKESGVNPLYFCFGFLEWKQSQSSDKKFTSPLLMLQVQMEEIKKGGKLKVFSTGDEISINLTLNEKLRKEFRIELPPIPERSEEEEIFSIEDYFKEVEKLAHDQNWKFRRWVSFGIYNAQNMPIYRDIEQMQSDGDLSTLLEKLLVGTDRDSGQGSTAEIYEVDSKENQKKVPALVRSADSSQFSAVVDAINGKNIVLKGPPGTGKSQTITNMIAALCSEGKKVLFVAQKQAALDVVRNNLEAIGSKDYLLEIFSIKANKKAVMESIRTRSEKAEPNGGVYFEEDLKLLNKVKGDLNKYTNFINSPYKNTDKTIHGILWDQIEIDEILLNKFSSFEVLDPQNISDSVLEDGLSQLELLKEFCRNYFLGFNIFGAPIRKIKKQIINPIELNSKINEFSALSESFTSYLDNLSSCQTKNPTLSQIPLGQLSSNKLIRQWCTEEDASLKTKLINFLISQEDHSSINVYLKDKEDYIEAERKFIKEKELVSKEFSFDSEDSLYSLKELKEAAKELINTSFASYFTSEWWRARKTFNALCILPNEQRTFSSIEAGKKLEVLYKHFNTKHKVEENINNLKKIVSKKEEKFLQDIEQDTLDDLYSNKDFVEETISQLGQLDREFINSWHEGHENIKDYFEFINGFEDLIKKVKESFKSFDIEYENLIPDELDSLESYQDLDLFITQLESQVEYIPDYMRFLVQEELIADKNVKEFYKHFNLAGIDISEVSKFYKYFIRNAQKIHIQVNHSKELAQYDGVLIESLRKQLNELDKRVESKYQKEVANKIHGYGMDAPLGKASGKVSEKREMGLIEHLANVQNPRMSIREFMGKANNAVMALKPCSLMSPLTVSQTLPLKEVFDVVVIDEASQMKPEYALGAIARAKQAIIVGDPNQLPPTTFYQATSSEDEWDDDLSDESILDMAMTVFFPPRELLWHYRSRHEDLIKFSNAKFYQNLLIPITADGGKKDRGIDYQYLEKGIYMSGSGAGAGGINPVEANAIVDEVINLMKERPNESIGVATMNIKQKDFIQSEFDLRASRDLKVMQYLGYWTEKNQGLEEFFVKNLENVQGDERDVILISTVYGPNQEGTVHQRFGPINGKFGGRRLNVLFSRAKNQIKLFTSLKSSQITLSESSSKGLSVFKDYLTFAETGILQEGEVTGHEIESPFQQWAVDMINSFPGFIAKHEIGVQGYRIDIGVEHEDFPHGFIMAVETDGATYHSSRSARDRDKLRQEILESHGWVFHRIWSTDWINNPVKEKEKLRKALEDRLQEVISKLEVSQPKDDSEVSRKEDTDGQTDETFEEANLDSYPYIVTNIDDYMHVNADKFYDRSYTSGLENAVTNIIDLEGPVSFDVIIERIKAAHGFGKAGAKIRSVVAKVIPQGYRTTTHKFNGEEKRFYWPKDFDPKDWRGARYPNAYEEESLRELFDISPQEIHAISRMPLEILSSNNIEESIEKQITDFLGWNRCTEQMAKYINLILEKEYLSDDA